MKKDIIKQIGVNVLTVVMAIVLFRSVSYSVDENNSTDNKDLLIETGNMQIVLSVPNDNYSFLNTLKYNVSDEVGKRQDGYNFTITNTGNIPIEYYEIRLVDEENKISTLPHKALKFIINQDNGSYSEVNNLGDTDSILFMGKNLDVGKSTSFNLKMWLDELAGSMYNKELHSALEVILYQKYDMNNYVLYDGEGDNMPFRTSIYLPISSVIPKKAGYNFLGWSITRGGEVIYHSGDTYNEKTGTTLYAIWEKSVE